MDTSAFLKLVLDEPGRHEMQTLWSGARQLVASRFLYPESRAALGLGRRTGRLSPQQAAAARRACEHLMQQIAWVEPSELLLWRAGDLAERHNLRAGDAVHLASAEAVAADEFVMVSGDRRLLGASEAIGFETICVP